MMQELYHTCRFMNVTMNMTQSPVVMPIGGWYGNNFIYQIGFFYNVTTKIDCTLAVAIQLITCK